MKKIDPNQTDIFTFSFAEKFPDYLKPYAIDILKKLYTENRGLNIKEAYYLFNNSKNEKVRETLEKLSINYNLIRIDKNKCKGSEKRYFLTEYGKKALTDHYRT